LNLYLVFVISWFLHLPARFELLGTIRFDLLLACTLIGITLVKPSSSGPPTQASKALRILIAYSILTIPFVYWPGSVLKFGLPNFIKAVVFFYFTLAFVRTESDLRKFLFVFLSCQLLRILEPLYLNLTQDYWGAKASTDDWGYLTRLSGAPSDVVNPNGLAFVVCTVLPFLYFMVGLSSRYRLIFLMLAPPCLYVLALTGSRSGIVGLLVVVAGIILKAKSRGSLMALVVAGVVVLAFAFSSLDPDLQDRYLSLIGQGQHNLTTAAERWDGMEAPFQALLSKPVIGYGLGTSAEVNSNLTTTGPYAGRVLLVHNLYLEVAIELGVVGLIIFLFFLKALFSGFAQSRKAVRLHHAPAAFLPRLIDAMEVWLVMNVVFSFASYGLSSYEWYLFGGLSVLVRRLSEPSAAGASTMASEARRS
jgi:O-antigen ligase